MKAVKRGMLALGAGLVMTPVAMGLGVVLLVAAFGDNDGGALPVAGGLRVGGRGGVPPRYAQLIVEAAAACDQGLPASVLAAQLRQESGFDPSARSPAGAEGIAQFMPGTWQTRGVDGNGDGRADVWDPQDAIPAQARFMCALLRKAKAHPQYAGSPIELALAAYNAGWGAVVRFRGVPPPSFAGGETYRYVRSIMALSALYATPAGLPGGPVALPPGYELPADAPAEVRTAVAWALRQRGGWYHLGGDCTAAHGGDPARWCDCSSLVQQAYRAAGVALPRVTYDQVRVGRAVGLEEVKAGDLVFNPGSDGSDTRPGHVGMYVGSGLVVEAPHTGVRTRLVPYASWRNSTSAVTRVTAVRRVVDW